MQTLEHETDFAIWAIDPFEEKIEPHQFEVQNLLAWMKLIQLEVRPVYILDLSVSSHPIIDQSVEIDKEIEIAKLAMKNYLRKIKCANTLSPKVFINYDTQQDGRVENLLKLSSESHAKMIILSSRGRGGLDKFIFGSFAESILLKSKVPLYFLTHQFQDKKEATGTTILFPTDFSQRSQRAFERVLDLAHKSHLQILLYYAISISPTVMTGDGTILIPDDYYSVQETEANRSAKVWLEKADTKGVEMKFKAQNLGIGSNVGPAILDLARAMPIRMIAMASSSGRIGSVFFGSVARDVFRANLFPVWICGPKT